MLIGFVRFYILQRASTARPKTFVRLESRVRIMSKFDAKLPRVKNSRLTVKVLAKDGLPNMSCAVQSPPDVVTSCILPASRTITTQWRGDSNIRLPETILKESLKKSSFARSVKPWEMRSCLLSGKVLKNRIQ